MSEYNRLYKQIADLNTKIKRLENAVNVGYYRKGGNTRSTNITHGGGNGGSKSTLCAYRIHYPKDSNVVGKKYVGLKFSDSTNDFGSEQTPNPTLLPFIPLHKSNIIINYTIQLDVCGLSSLAPCSVSVGIKTRSDSKIRIIKGTKSCFDLTNTIGNKLCVTQTVLYAGEDGEELCVVADLGPGVMIDSKSIIKLLFV